MPVCIAFHEGYALTLYGMCNNCCRHALSLFCFLESCSDLIKIMCICQINHMEIKCFELLINRIRRTYILNLTINLKTIVIYDNTEIVKLSVAGKHCCFPHLAFFNLTITKQCIYTERITAHFSSQCHTTCY